MVPKRILVLGGGFAGLWAAAGAARKLDELGIAPGEVAVTLVNRDAFHAIRVRNYEADLASARVPLDDVLGPIGVGRVEGEVASIDVTGRAVGVRSASGMMTIGYDRLVFALGSQVVRPAVPGASEFGFDVDTYEGATRLDAHLRQAAKRDEPGPLTVVVVGAGLTGVETAAEMPGRLRAILAEAGSVRDVRVILADRSPVIGSDMGDSARPVIEEALATLGVETRAGVDVVASGREGLRLGSGEDIPAAAVVWCAGLRASPLARGLHAEPDRLGRIPVDACLRVEGVPGVFAAGDSARMMVDDEHASVMSCQHSRPMGRFAGHNVVCDLLGLPMLPLRIDWYVTVLDLGPWGALYTEGWGRHVVTRGEAAKATKRIINRERIYPPADRDRRAILDAAAAVVQAPPATYRKSGP